MISSSIICDILLDLKDEGYNYSLSDCMLDEYITVRVVGAKEKSFNYSDIINTAQHLINYMNSEGYVVDKKELRYERSRTMNFIFTKSTLQLLKSKYKNGYT